MGTLNVRTDDAMETALAALTQDRSRSEAVRYALLRAYKETLLDQARADAERLADDPDDRTEMLAIQRFMGVVE
jgi:Arc/MetJ-type ribon-helix-helix transcriptional regulator